MAEKPTAVLIVSGRGGVPTIPDKPQGAPGIQDCAEECSGPLYKHLGASFTPEAIRQGHNPGRKSQSQRKLEAAMSEVMHNTPSTVTRADVSPERKQKMKVAIAYSKAREAGARLPRKGK